MTHGRNRLLAFLFHATLSMCAVSLLATSSASAQTGSPTRRELRLQYVPTGGTMEELQREYDSIRLWGPALGVPVSYFTVVGERKRRLRYEMGHLRFGS